MRDFNHTIGVLVNAYLNDSLIHGSCTACAVGNMIADAKGYTLSEVHKTNLSWIDRTGSERWPSWDEVFISDGVDCGNYQSVFPFNYCGKAKDEIDSTGYAWEELARIEKAFESVSYNGTQYTHVNDKMFDGLMAVVDVLADIHGIDLTTREETKKLFVKETTG